MGTLLSKTDYFNQWNEIFRETIAAKWTAELAGCMKMENIVIKDVMSQSEDAKATHEYLKSSIAIIGLSCRFPGANSANEFWDLLVNKVDAIGIFPNERMDPDPKQGRCTVTKGGFLKCSIDEFDAQFFGISPREAEIMDPQQKLLTEVSWEAFENAAVNLKLLHGSNTAVYTGISANQYEQHVVENTKGTDFYHLSLGNAFSATSARISYTLGLNGPNIATESGCSSSMVSVHLACTGLRNKETDMALVAGVQLQLKPFPQEDMLLFSNDGHCKTFDAKADGFGRAEGCAAIVLKRYSDAIKDGDSIQAIIRGSGISTEGTTMSFGRPSKQCQEIAIREAIKHSGIDPNSVDFVEAHGTGTPVGDPIEFSAIESVYGGRNRSYPLIIGSVKTNIGHTEAAAGLAGIVKVILSMKNEYIPAHMNFESLNPLINLKSIPAVIPLEGVEWQKAKGKNRLAGVSSFGLSGTNVHVILQEPPMRKLYNNSACLPHQQILTMSAKSDDALSKLKAHYTKYLKNSPELGSVAFTTNTGRYNFKHRLAVTGRNSSEVWKRLQEANFSAGIASEKKSRVAFLFTGQGSQYVNMGKQLYFSHPVFKHAIDQCSTLVKSNLDIDLLDLLWGKKTNDSLLEKTVNSQTVIFCIEYALLQLWNSVGVYPDVVLGHSTGEFAAAVAAGVLSLKDALHILCERSRLIQNLPPGKMLAIMLSKEELIPILAKFHLEHSNLWLDIAVVNTEKQVVVAGSLNSVTEIKKICYNQGIKTHMLAATHAFHSRHMDPILKKFQEVASTISYKVPLCSYVSSYSDQMVNDFNADYWIRHTRNMVNYPRSVQLLRKQDCKVYIEIGPQPILLALLSTNLNTKQRIGRSFLPSLKKGEDEWSIMLSSIAQLYTIGVDIDWKSLYSSHTYQKLEAPTYPFERQKHWLKTISNSDYIFEKTPHPLLGKKLSTLPGNHVYYNTIDLHTLSYVRDHQVCENIIFPGAGFLEMMLAAGQDVLTDGITADPFSSFKIVVDSFYIEGPLVLQTGVPCTTQVVASFLEGSDSERLSVSVYSKNTVNTVWKKHSTGMVALVQKTDKDIEKSNITSEVKSRCENISSSDVLYKRVWEAGIQLGDSLRSILKTWEGTNEVLSQVSAVNKGLNWCDYIQNPVVLDAMMQTIVCNIDRNQDNIMHLIVAIGKFESIHPYEYSQQIFAHAAWQPDKLSGNVTLYNCEGKPFARMSEIRLVETSKELFTNIIRSQINTMPDMFEESWLDTGLSTEPRFDLLKTPSKKKLLEAMSVVESELIREYNDEYISGKYDLIDRICCYFLIRTLLELGWKPRIDQIVTAKNIMTDLKIIKKYQRFVHRILETLAEDEILTAVMSGENKVYEWAVNIVPCLAEVNLAIENYKKRLHKDEVQEELVLLYRCSDNLAAILVGDAESIPLLFSKENTEGDLSEYYSNTTYDKLSISRMKFCLQEIFGKSFFGDSQKSILRVLEIGAGTGGTTRKLIEGLQELQIPFCYTFTDISQHFLSKAMKRFDNISTMEYMILDIEKDPKGQGFAPHQYDVIVASNVLHATEYIHESVSNIRHLLVPSGILMLGEMCKPIRHIDIIFGPLKGYWRFKDTDLRPNHPMISYHSWKNVLSECEFVSVEILGSNEITSTIFCRASSSIAQYNNSRSLSCLTEKNCWVLFSNNDSVMENYIKFNLESCGEFVITVYSGDIYQKFHTQCYFINSTNLLDVSKVLQVISEEYNCIKIIYFWGICHTNEQIVTCGNLLHITQYLQVRESISDFSLFLITRGVYYIGDQCTGHPTASTTWGVLKTFSNERQNFLGKAIDLDPNVPDPILESTEIFNELWLKDSESQVAFRKNKRYILRISRINTKQQNICITPYSDRYSLNLSAAETIKPLTLVSATKGTLGEDEVEVAVKAVSLNFRDTLVVTEPRDNYTASDTVGSDFSGIVTEVGSNVKTVKISDKVFGISLNRTAIASHVVVKSNALLHKPQHLTFADSATLPTVFLTAYYCIRYTAELKTGQTILIHAASGGVGLAAIQIAKNIGANIVATAGTKRKRIYLRNLGIKYVFHSRDVSYGDQVLSAINGVDVVLNSLTGSDFKETSLKICNHGAHFIDIGKDNIDWNVDKVKLLRSDVKYTVVDLRKLIVSEMMNCMKDTENDLINGMVKPLPHTVFTLSHIEDAFNYMMKAQHIGKVVVSMPEIRAAGSRTVISERLFNDDSTYIITGGLGGIGLEVAKWMLTCGAKFIVLAGRTVPNQATADILKSLNRNHRIVAMQVDVVNMNECTKLFRALECNKQFPPLKGIFHAAGIISDGTILNQSWGKFEEVFNAKVNGTWNLHLLTKEMHLEYFVLFSSVCAIFGFPGQSNHAAANMFMDSLAHYRHSMGLPAQSINWGAWSDVGRAKNIARFKTGATGICSFSSAQGIVALKYILSHHLVQVVVTDLNPQILSQRHHSTRKYLDELLSCVPPEHFNGSKIDSNTFWNEISPLTETERLYYCGRILEGIIRTVLRLPISKVVDSHQTFSDMGIDSLMAVEVSNCIQEITGKNLNIYGTTIMDCSNINELKIYLAKLSMSENVAVATRVSQLGSPR